MTEAAIKVDHKATANQYVGPLDRTRLEEAVLEGERGLGEPHAVRRTRETRREKCIMTGGKLRRFGVQAKEASLESIPTQFIETSWREQDEKNQTTRTTTTMSHKDGGERRHLLHNDGSAWSPASSS